MPDQDNTQNPSNLIQMTNKTGYPKVPLFEILSQTAKLYPNRIAITYMKRDISYCELNSFSDHFGASLVDLGIKKGDRIAIFIPNSPQFIIAYFGILKAGGIVTAINPLHKEREVEHQLIDSEAKLIVSSNSLFSIIKKIYQSTRLEKIILTCLEEKPSSSGINYNKKFGLKISNFKALLKSSITLPKIFINSDEDLAALQYTGGTTGTTKAAMLTHANLVANAMAFAAWIKGLQGKEVFLATLPLSHIYGLTTSLNVPIALAAKIVLLPRFEPGKALYAIQRHNVTIFCGVPTMYQSLLSCSELSKFCLSSLRVCISGASPLPVQIQKKFIQITGELLIEGYGLTEASPVTHCNPVDESLRTVNMGSIGLPLLGTEARIVDAETGTKSLSTGEVGELVIKGPQVMQGYWKNPQETAMALRDGWLYTGDLARKDANGYYYLTDRKKDIIKYKGYSIYPRELEEIICEHPDVKICAVVGKPDAAAGEVPKAIIVPKENSSITIEELKVFVNSKVAPYKAIRDVELRKELPFNPAGKILRRML